jgi:hypothetical protein
VLIYIDVWTRDGHVSVALLVTNGDQSPLLEITAPYNISTSNLTVYIALAECSVNLGADIHILPDW